MSSLILDLQQELLQNNCDILNVLRKAHVIAKKLDLLEFDQWILSELNGYKGNHETVPDYRQLKGELRAKNPYHGWIPFLFSNNKLENQLSIMPAYESISELLEVKQRTKTGYFTYKFPAEQTAQLMKMTDSPIMMEIALFISIHHIGEIIERVKNTLLEWTLKLEKEGIVGENMVFNKSEKESAKDVPQQINYYGTVINGSVTNSQIVSGNNSNIFNYEIITEVIDEIKAALEKHSFTPDDKETALELLSDISEKVESKKKPSLIKAGLIGLKDFLLNCGAGVLASLIQMKIQGIF